MTTRTARTAAALAAIVAAAAATVARAPAARGALGPQTAELGSGGTVRGDISMEPGEEDVVAIDLDERSRLDVALASEFFASMDLEDPAGSVVLTFPPGYSKVLQDFVVHDAGRYHLRIASADGSQGMYTLTAVEHFPTKVVSGTFTDPTITFRAPAGGSVKATIAAKPSKAWDPRIASLTAPDLTDLLAAPVAGAKGVARLAKTTLTSAGEYALQVGGGAPGAKFHASVTIKGPKVPTVRVDLRNGLTPVPPVSFAADGVGAIFYSNCAYCHGWAASYNGVEPRALTALAYIRSGAMPRGGPRLKPADIALIQSWVSTGENP